MRVANIALAVLTVLTVLVVLVAWRVGAHERAYPEAPRETARVSEVYPGLKTGDVVLFNGALNRSAVARLAAFERFSHAALVVVPARAGGAPYLSEMNPKRILRDDGGGAGRYPLLFRLKTYDGAVYLARRRRRLTAAQEAAVRRAIQAPARYPSILEIVLAAVGLGGAGDPPRRHCLLHVAQALHDAGVVAPAPGFYSAGAFLRGGAYAEPVRLLYDV